MMGFAQLSHIQAPLPRSDDHLLLELGSSLENVIRAASDGGTSIPLPPEAFKSKSKSKSSIKQHLRKWQQQQAKESNALTPSALTGMGALEQVESDLIGRPKMNDDDARFDDDALNIDVADPVEDNSIHHVDIAPGDMVALRQLLQVYTIRGEVAYVYPRRISRFSLSRFISHAELSPLIPHLPTRAIEQSEEGKFQVVDTAVPREIGAHLIEKMLHLNNLAGEVYRKHADRCDRAWEIMTCSAYTNHVPLEDIAMLICQQNDRASISTPMLWCIFQLLEFNPGFVKKTDYHRSGLNYTIISKGEGQNRQKVAEWVREYQEQLASASLTDFDDASNASEVDNNQGYNPVKEFARKAQPLIQSSREIRDAREHGRLGPCRIAAGSYPIDITNDSRHRFHFGKKEEKIIRFLYEWVVDRTIDNYSHLYSVGPSILRAIGMYANLELDRPTGLLLLQELGVLLPWENWSVYSRNLILPGHGMDSTADKLREVATSSTLSIEDSMVGLRKDWGSLPVFCVDPAQTTEVDDGISWEAIDESNCWVHVHIANPSAFIKPDSPVAEYAARLTQTVYLPERRYLMLESESLLQHCSLKANAPTISFSARLNTDGEILESKISHGIIRNVKRVTYETLDSALSPHAFDGSQTVDSATVLTVRGELPSENTSPPDQILTESEVFILRKLMQISEARRFKGVEGTERDGRQGVTSKVDTQVYLGENHPPFAPCMEYSRLARGDPIISLKTQPFDSEHTKYASLAVQMIADLMLLAGAIAARWCTERGIPIGYSCTKSNPQQQLSKQKYLQEVYNPIVARYGRVPVLLSYGKQALMGRASLSAQPAPHEHLNLVQYAQVTSPLRRYNDLRTHWQIDAAVRQEARTGTSLVGNTDQSFLPFDLNETQRSVEKLNTTISDLKSIQKLTRRHWIIQWFNRAYYYNEVPLPKPLHICILGIDPVQNYNQGVIKELGIYCEITAVDAAKAQASLEMGDTWEADVQELNPLTHKIVMNPVRLVEKSAIDYGSYMYPKPA
ncbi:MAG: hypothetical protein Q9191_000039 [Dirinaria sp. TL-2023a]